MDHFKFKNATTKTVIAIKMVTKLELCYFIFSPSCNNTKKDKLILKQKLLLKLLLWLLYYLTIYTIKNLRTFKDFNNIQKNIFPEYIDIYLIRSRHYQYNN